MKFSRIALLSAASLAVAQPQHNHARLHKKGTPVEARDAAYTTVVAGPVVTIYELNGQSITYDDVQAGIKSGKYVLIGDTLQSVAQPPPPPSTSAAPPPSSTPAPASSSVKAAVFAEKATTSAAPIPTTTSAAPVQSSSSSQAPASSPPASSPSKPSSGHGDVNAEFPSGTIDCSSFPSDYGAVYVDWLNLSGWIGIQKTPGYNSGSSKISEIHTGVDGGCEPNSFCSYACPPGYQKSQWPTAQGATGQSIGGLFCNSQGKLELSRPTYKTICQKGAGGVSVKNKLNKNVAVCRTDYPGSESETVPLDCAGGATLPVTNPIAAEYYAWEGAPTSAQYYINPAGASVSDACKWGSAGTNLGNWAPVNMGVGTTDFGTFLSIFPNAPTNPDGKLDFTIEITGDVTGKCEYKNGQFYTNGNPTPTGCTAGVKKGGEAVFEFS